MNLAVAAESVLKNLSDVPVPSLIDELVLPQDSQSLGLTQQERLRLLQELQGLGPIEELLQDDTISEVLILGKDKIFFEKKGTLIEGDQSFLSEQTFLRFLNHIFNHLDKVASARHPIIEGALNENTRIHITLPPVSRVPLVSLRKHTFRSKTFQELQKLGMLTQDQAEMIQSWVEEKKNLLIIGTTGSGKTTLLRSLLELIPPRERIIALEDTPELGPLEAPSLALCTRHDPEGLMPEVSLSHLIKASLRMRPDRIVVGEVRGEEALYLVDAMATGHSGSMGTLHAASPAEGLRRLASLVSRGAPQWSEQNINQLIKDAFDGIIQVTKTAEGQRVVSTLATLEGVESFGFLLNEIRRPF